VSAIGSVSGKQYAGCASQDWNKTKSGFPPLCPW